MRRTTTGPLCLTGIKTSTDFLKTVILFFVVHKNNMFNIKLIVVLIAASYCVSASPIEDKLKELDADVADHEAEENEKCSKDKLGQCTSKLLEYALDDTYPVPETESDVQTHCG